MRPRLRRAFDRFSDISPLSDIEAAKKIHADGIQILIDLKGFTQATRTSILALRPAPLQVNYLGYPRTLGDGLCDYIVTDSFVTPCASAVDYAESHAFLPHSYQPRGRHGLIRVCRRAPRWGCRRVASSSAVSIRLSNSRQRFSTSDADCSTWRRTACVAVGLARSRGQFA